MTLKELKRVKKIYGIGFERIDVPTIIRNRDRKKELRERKTMLIKN